MSLLRNRLFLIYNIRVAAVSLGNSLYAITIPAYSLLVTGNLVFTGITLFVEYGIYSITFIAGSIVDRVEDKRRIIVASTAVIAVSSLFLGITMHQSVLNRPLFLFLVAVIAVGWDFAWTANYYVLPIIVKEDELMKANGYKSAVGNAHVGAGLFIGAFFLIITGAYGAMITYAFCMAVAATATAMIPLRISKESRKQKSGFISGWRYTLTRSRSLLLLSFLVIPSIAFFSSVPELAITYLFVQNSTLLYVLMFSIMSAGSMAIGILIGRLNPSRKIILIIVLMFLFTGMLIISGIALRSFIIPDAIVWFFIGVFTSGRYPLYDTYLQSVTEKEMLGRVASNMYLFRGASLAAGTLMIPYIADMFGADQTFIASGIIVVMLSVVMIVALPGLMKKGIRDL